MTRLAGADAQGPRVPRHTAAAVLGSALGGDNRLTMCELSTLLHVVKINGRPLACEHAVLISESGPEAASDWVVSILGVRASDFDWAVAARIFSTTGSEGELYGGVVQSAPGSSAWHVRLQGSGALRAVCAHRDAAAQQAAEQRRFERSAVAEWSGRRREASRCDA